MLKWKFNCKVKDDHLTKSSKENTIWTIIDALLRR